MAQDLNTKQFLDYNGLSTLWTNITNKFATKGEAISSITATHDTNDESGNTFDIIYQTAASGSIQQKVNIPVATASNSGLMSTIHYDTIEDLRTNVAATVPFIGLQLEDEDVKITDRKSNIKLEYIEGSAATGDANKIYIALKDAASNGTAITKLDVTHLVKHGFLKESDVVINPSENMTGTYLQLVFSTGSDGNNDDTVYINVTDLVDTYVAGEGITIGDYTNAGADDVARVGTISVNAATDTDLGAIKTGYTPAANETRNYAVQLDTNNKAYVAVPWTDTITTVVEANNSDIEVGDTDSGNNKIYTLDLTADAKTKLNAGDSAIQTITIGSKTLTKLSNTYTVNNAKADLELGTASNSNRVTAINAANATSTVQGTNQPTVPTTQAVMDYISGEIGKLDSDIEAGKVTNNWPNEAPAADREAQTVWKKIVITNGALDEDNSEVYSLKIKDITDFRPLSVTEINEICGVTVS